MVSAETLGGDGFAAENQSGPHGLFELGRRSNGQDDQPVEHRPETRRDWQGAERRRKTFRFTLRHSVLLACTTDLFSLLRLVAEIYRIMFRYRKSCSIRNE